MALTPLQVAQGKYELRVEMAAFATGTREIVLGEPGTRADLELTLLSRTQQARAPAAAPNSGRKPGERDFKAWP